MTSSTVSFDSSSTCWCCVGAYLLDSYVITPNVYMDLYTYLLFTVIPGVAAFFVWQICFSR